jgi:hypothetical protein
VRRRNGIEVDSGFADAAIFGLNEIAAFVVNPRPLVRFDSTDSGIFAGLH